MTTATLIKVMKAFAAKPSYTARELADVLDSSESMVRELLKKLEAAEVVIRRSVRAPPGTTGIGGYIFHINIEIRKPDHDSNCLDSHRNGSGSALQPR